MLIAATLSIALGYGTIRSESLMSKTINSDL